MLAHGAGHGERASGAWAAGGLGLRLGLGVALGVALGAGEGLALRAGTHGHPGRAATRAVNPQKGGTQGSTRGGNAVNKGRMAPGGRLGVMRPNEAEGRRKANQPRHRSAQAPAPKQQILSGGQPAAMPAGSFPAAAHMRCWPPAL